MQLGLDIPALNSGDDFQACSYVHRGLRVAEERLTTWIRDRGTGMWEYGYPYP